jgi:hypothetical protein
VKAKFTRGTDSRFGIRFEPEIFEEQLLLEQFAQWSTDLRFKLGPTWGEFVKKTDHKADALAEKALTTLAKTRTQIKLSEFSRGSLLADLRSIINLIEVDPIAALKIAKSVRQRVEQLCVKTSKTSLRSLNVGDAFRWKDKPPAGYGDVNMLVVDKPPGYALPEGWDFLPIELLDGEIELVTPLTQPNTGISDE